MSKLGIMICGHGSRNQNAMKEFAKLSEGLKGRFGEVPVEYGYLEFANPVISHGLDTLREQGCTRVLAVPGMLFAAGHAKNDIPIGPQHLCRPESGHSDHYGRELGDRPEDDPRRRSRFRALAAAEAQVGPPTTPADGGRARCIGPGRQFQRRQDHADAVGGAGLWLGRDLLFRRDLPAGRARPRARGRLGYRRIVVFPVFPVHRRAGRSASIVYRRGGGAAPGHRIRQGGYLNDHPLVIDTLPTASTRSCTART